jgi:hypothetical protein
VILTISNAARSEHQDLGRFGDGVVRDFDGFVVSLLVDSLNILDLDGHSMPLRGQCREMQHHNHIVWLWL